MENNKVENKLFITRNWIQIEIATIQIQKLEPYSVNYENLVERKVFNFIKIRKFADINFKC